MMIPKPQLLTLISACLCFKKSLSIKINKMITKKELSQLIFLRKCMEISPENLVFGY